MKFNRSAVRTLFVTEMRMVLRDRRVLLTAILLPVLIMPMLLAGSHWTLKRRETRLKETVYRFSTIGPDADVARQALLSASDDQLDTASPNADGSGIEKASPPKFNETKAEDPIAALEQNSIDLVLEVAKGETTLSTPPQAGAASPARTKDSKNPRHVKKGTSNVVDDDAERPVAGAPVIRIIFRADRDVSAAAAARAGDQLRQARRAKRIILLDQHAFPAPPAQVARITETDVAPKSRIAGLALGRSITLLLLFLILTSGSVVATDSLAGEKERGTLETLLTTSAHRGDVIISKLFVILTVAGIITVIQSANLLLYVGLKLIPVPANFAVNASPAAALLLFFLFLPVAALAGSVLLLISGYAKSYKEAQMYFFPVFLLGLIPGLTPMVPGLSLRSAIVFVPVANIALAARQILIGDFDWLFIIPSWLVTLAAAGWTTSLSIRSLSNERLITASEAEPVIGQGGTLFSRHILRWYVAMWALLLIVNNYLEKADLRLQIFINLVMLLFGGSCLILRYYHLDLRQALSLRPARPATWLAVVAGVPSALIAASGLFQLVNYFIPVSSKLMQQFDEAVIPPDMGFVQLLFFLSIMPGIFEEIAFRGVLLFGLSRRFRPAVTVLLVGIIFGFFHVALFRFAPTALLGIILAVVTILTRSIFPAMLWHAASNAASIFAFKLKIPLNELDPLSYLLGTAILGLSLWIVWRNRAPSISA